MGPGSEPGPVPGPKFKRNRDRDQSSEPEMAGTGTGTGSLTVPHEPYIQKPFFWVCLKQNVNTCSSLLR